MFTAQGWGDLENLNSKNLDRPRPVQAYVLL